jgi:hypothetical protein
MKRLSTILMHEAEEKIQILRSAKAELYRALKKA